MRLTVSLLLLALAASPTPSLAQSTLDTRADRTNHRREGRHDPGRECLQSHEARTDVKIQVDQWTMPPFMGLGSWAAFTPAHGGAC